jgi:hypothetical protein
MEVDSSSVSASVSKRKLSEEDNDGEQLASPLSEEDSMETDSPSDSPVPVKPEALPHLAQKKAKESSNDVESQPSSSKNTSAMATALNCPLPGETGVSCLVKVYSDADSFKLNDTVEFIGILSVDPVLGYQEQPHELNSKEGVVVDPASVFEEALEEKKAHSPPPSLVPRLHCIFATKLSHSNPLLPRSLKIPVEPEIYQSLSAPLGTARMEVMDLLSCLLFGDRLAAEYLLLHLLSDVYARTDTISLGKFSLNLIGFPCQKRDSSDQSTGSSVSAIASAISELVCKCHIFPLTLENMNSSVFLPEKDYEANRLKTGMLQLSDNTHLVLDETVMTTGELDSNGVKNLSALSNLITWQRVAYDFHYHTTDFACNVPVLILSEGKSLLPHDCCVKVLPVSLHPINPVGSIPVDQLNRLRTYIGLHRSLQYRLPDQIQHFLEQDFVDMRKESADKMNADVFHQMLCMARLMTISHGQSELSLETWNYVKKLEKERTARLIS